MFGMNRFTLAGVLALLLLASHAGTYALGWHRGYAASEGKWAAEKLELLAAAEARAKVLRERGDRLAAELEQARAQVRVEYVDKIRVIYRTASRSKEALSAAVTAALNRQPIRESATPVAPDPEPVAGTSEAAAAEWIAGAQAAYEACREQVRALAEWAKGVSK